jgi:hypothetical protein
MWSMTFGTDNILNPGQRVFCGLFLVVVAVPALGIAVGLCAVPLVVAPLQLGGALGGFACPGSHYWNPGSWICS